uniref:Uncharacterized protein n=1 Tax=virus sp. ctML55 TaxID=2827627 RepID=A0A8S5RH63_9VIRU|nr:MAG TPA: hypothetical protein [virus sp. ctML55]DAO59190.1 MAG TPA: hypothetical protein [Bacteriophage sp.]
MLEVEVQDICSSTLCILEVCIGEIVQTQL